MTESREAQFRRIMPEDEGYSGLEVDERRLYGEPDRWPIHSMSGRELYGADAGRWLNDHGENSWEYDEGDDEHGF